MGVDNSKRSWDLAVVSGVNVIKHGWRLHGCWEEQELSGRRGHCWKQQIMWLQKSRKRIPSPNRSKQTHRAKKRNPKKPRKTSYHVWNHRGLQSLTPKVGTQITRISKESHCFHSLSMLKVFSIQEKDLFMFHQCQFCVHQQTVCVYRREGSVLCSCELSWLITCFLFPSKINTTTKFNRAYQHIY